MNSSDLDKLANKLLPFILRKIRQASAVQTTTPVSGGMSTAAIMTAVLSADGPGSTLDADTVDGEHASAFADAVHAHTTLPVAIKSANYTLTAADSVVVFTATATALLPAATGTGQTYRIVCRAGTLTIDGDGVETVKGEATQTLLPGDDLIVSDVENGVWE